MITAGTQFKIPPLKIPDTQCVSWFSFSYSRTISLVQAGGTKDSIALSWCIDLLLFQAKWGSPVLYIPRFLYSLVQYGMSLAWLVCLAFYHYHPPSSLFRITTLYHYREAQRVGAIHKEEQPRVFRALREQCPSQAKWTNRWADNGVQHQSQAKQGDEPDTEFIQGYS